MDYSQRRACQPVGIAPKTYRYISRRADKGEVRVRLQALANERRWFGYRRLHILLAQERHRLNHKKLFRLYRAERLGIRWFAVVGDGFWQAKRGLDALTPRWEGGSDIDSAGIFAQLAAAGAASAATLEARREGDAAAALAGSARRLERFPITLGRILRR